jgi:hypothetical protein
LKNYKIEEFFEYEKECSRNNYEGTENKLGFKYKAGKNRILLSAPHTVRIGNKYPETFIAAMLNYVHKKHGVHIMYKNYNTGENANLDEESPYREYLLDVINREDIEMVIDVHGMAKHRDYDIDIGTHDGETIHSNRLLKDIHRSFEKHNILGVRENCLFHAISKNTVTRYVYEHAKVTSVQLEINTHYRSPVEEWDHYKRLVASFETLIESLLVDEKEILKSNSYA